MKHTLHLLTWDRDTLPSISHLDLESIKQEKNDLSRFALSNGLSISTTLASPTSSMYSGPPPPYTSAPATHGPNVSGYISPPESTTRRSTRDDKDSVDLRKSLPSIHEALGDKSMSFPPPLPGVSQHQSLPTPSTAVATSFSDAPRGPSNPFSQPSSANVMRDVFGEQQKPISTPSEAPSSQPFLPSISTADPRQAVSQHFGYPGSPRTQQASTFRSSSLLNTSFTHANDNNIPRSPKPFEAAAPQPPHPSFPQYNTQPTADPYHFSAGTRGDESPRTFTKPGSDAQYSDTVKRHLEVFDAEIGLNEVRMPVRSNFGNTNAIQISEASARTQDFARIWAQRYHQSGHSGYYQDALPGIHEVDDIMRQSHRIYENLGFLREVIVAQQNALSEQRARLARGTQMEEEYNGSPDDYKIGGLASMDAKKRRGVCFEHGCDECCLLTFRAEGRTTWSVS